MKKNLLVDSEKSTVMKKKALMDSDKSAAKPLFTF
jgi:hypothetical protein